MKPPIETSSINGAASNNGTVKETVTAHHSYIYTGGHLAQETITTTVIPADETATSTEDAVSTTASSTMSATANGTVAASSSVAAIASNSTTTTETLYYAYDANGVPMSLTYTDAEGVTETYYYATNIQGDVTAILDTTGIPVVEYTYDAWGNLLTTTGSLADTLGKANSLRYRGYAYDTETNLYYLQSRYYSPEMGRYINVDGYIITGQGLIGNNMLAYCLNNPVICEDETGAMCVLMELSGGGIPSFSKNEGNENRTSVISKLTSTLESIAYNFEFSAGIGQGIYAELSILDCIGAGIGMYGNYGTISYSDGAWKTGQEVYSGATASITPWLEFGAADYSFMQNGIRTDGYAWSGYNANQESYTLFSAACYLIYFGISFSISFDTITFTKDVDAIWKVR